MAIDADAPAPPVSAAVIPTGPVPPMISPVWMPPDASGRLLLRPVAGFYAAVDTSLIITIGTQYLFRGILLAFIGTVWIMDLPPQMIEFGRAPLLQFTNANGAVITLPVYFLALPAAAILTWWILNRTLMGRAIFAIGGNSAIAERLGYNLKTVQLFLFGYAGALAGLAGIIHVSSNRLANPFDLVGSEISVIAAVVLGGARITGGTGTVLGTILGVLLVTVLNNVLVMVGIPSTWQRFVIGFFILLAAAFFMAQQRKS